MRVCLDATPLDTAHRHRGIGRFVQGLVDALAGAPFPIVQLRRSWAPASPKNLMEVRRAWRPPKPGVRLQWLWNELRLPGEVRATGCHVFHATDPRGSPPAVATLPSPLPMIWRTCASRANTTTAPASTHALACGGWRRTTAG